MVLQHREQHRKGVSTIATYRGVSEGLRLTQRHACHTFLAKPVARSSSLSHHLHQKKPDTARSTTTAPPACTSQPPNPLPTWRRAIITVEEHQPPHLKSCCMSRLRLHPLPDPTTRNRQSRWLPTADGCCHILYTTHNGQAATNVDPRRPQQPPVLSVSVLPPLPYFDRPSTHHRTPPPDIH
jgi:hypothetical protein